MIPTASVPNLIAPPPVQAASAITSNPSDAAIGRIPFTTVPATINMPEIQNNARPNVPARAPAGDGGAARTANFNSILSGGSQAVGFSAPFIAQLMGQASSSGQQQAIANFFGFSAGQTLDSETIAQFAQVKYLPSNAAKPRPSIPQSQPMLLERPSSVSQANSQLEFTRVQQAQQSQQAAVRQASQPVSQASNAQASVASASVSAPRATSVSSVTRSESATPAPTARSASLQVSSGEEASSVLRSLVSNAPGVNSYLATESRNFVHLERAPVASVQRVL